LYGNKRGCDFNELIYGPRPQRPDELQLLLSLDLDYLSCHYAPDPLCQCGVPARHRVVPSELRYDYFYGNVVGGDDTWVSSYKRNCNMWFISILITMNSIESFNWQHTRSVTGRRSRVARNFLSKFEEKVISLER
jgi:hypothetical protein